MLFFFFPTWEKLEISLLPLDFDMDLFLAKSVAKHNIDSVKKLTHTETQAAP